MSDENDDVQVTLDGSKATRFVAVERADLSRARRVVYMAAEAAADGEIDADPERFANLGMRLGEALDRDDLESEQILEFDDGGHDE
jgi:hypothetical protein